MHTFKTIHTWSINQNFYGGSRNIRAFFYIHNLYHFQSAVHLWKGFKTMLWSVPSNIYLLTWQMLLFKETYCAFKVNIFSVDAFPGILAHDLGVASTMIYQFSGSRMYTKMPCVILIWIKHFFFNSTSSSGWLVLLLESTLRYCKLLHKEECLAKNIFYHSHILKTYTVHYMRHYSDRRMHSATIWLQHRAIKETQEVLWSVSHRVVRYILS